MNPYPITGYPQGADADSIGSLILASNAVVRKSGVTGKRTGMTNFPGGPLGVVIYAMFVLNGTTYAVCVKDGVLKLYNVTSTVYTQISTDLTCRNTSTYRKVFDDILDTFQVQEGRATQINCFPAVTTDGTNTVESGAPRCREIALVSEIDASAVAGGSIAVTLGLQTGERCAYRAVFSYVRKNGAEVSGAPSGRFVYSRGSADTPARVCPKLRINLPNGVPAYGNAGYLCYVSLYRSAILSQADTAALGAGSVDPSPSDELFLVFKKLLDNTDLSPPGVVDVIDVCPPGMAGEALYTNSPLGGSNAERWMLPKTNSAVVYKDTAFYGGAVDRFARVTFSLVAPPYVYAGPIVVTATTIKLPTTDVAVPVLVVGDVVSLACTAPALLADYVVNGVVTVAGGFVIVPVTAPPAAVTYTGVAVFGKLNVTVKDSTGGPTTYAVRASFSSASTGTAGKFLVSVRLAGTSPLNQRDLLQINSASICQGINMTLWAAGHNVVASNLSTGDLETATITIEADQATTLSIAASDTASDYRSMAARLAGVLTAQPDAGLNRLWWSTPGIYDHVCPSNVWFIGAPDKEILRLVATKDSLYIFKEDGTWILDGDGSGTWNRTELSTSLRLLAPCLAATYKDQVFAACNMGAVELYGASITVISDTIRDVYERMVIGRVSPALGAILGGTHTYADIFCNSCAPSWADSTITFSIPILAAATGGTPPMEVAYAIFVYCYDSKRWVHWVDVPYNCPTPEWGAEQHLVPLMARPATTIEAGLGLDATQKQVVRLVLEEYKAASCASIEIGAVSADLTIPRTFSDEFGLLAPQGCDLAVGRASDIDGDPTHLIFTLTVADTIGCMLTPVPADSVLIDPDGPDQWYWMDNTGALSRIAYFVHRDSLEFFVDADGAANPNSAGAILFPITARWRFSPVGDGSSAINFKQMALLQSRESTATRIKITYWLDNGQRYPYVAPTPQALGGSDTSRNVVRAEVPPKVTRGSRLNIELYHNMPNQRLELSKLLLDFEAIPGEEVEY